MALLRVDPLAERCFFWRVFAFGIGDGLLDRRR
jgi:hypothetical protein